MLKLKMITEQTFLLRNSCFVRVGWKNNILLKRRAWMMRQWAHDENKDVTSVGDVWKLNINC